MIGSKMCWYCDTEDYRHCYRIIKELGDKAEVVDINDICPKGRRIDKGVITFEKEVYVLYSKCNRHDVKRVFFTEEEALQELEKLHNDYRKEGYIKKTRVV